jgi:hypothetical protein
MTREEEIKALKNDIAVLKEMAQTYREGAKLIAQLKEDERTALKLIENGELDEGVAYTNHVMKGLSLDLSIELVEK